MARRFIIEAHSPGGREGLPTLIDSLEKAGVKVDAAFAPVMVDPKRQRFALRGEATPEAQDLARQKHDLDFFVDDPIEPT